MRCGGPGLCSECTADASRARSALAQPSPALAEAERPEVVARVVHSNPIVLGQCGPLNANDELMTVAQHAASVARWAEMFNRVEQQRDAALARVAELEKELAMARDAAAKGDAARHAAGGMEMEIQELREKVTELQKKLRSRWTYASTQATNCAGCGEYKHTPLRVDWMGGYVCLTCIDKKLEELHDDQAQHSVPEEFSFEYRHPNGESHTVTVSRDQVINEMPDFLFEALCSKFCNCEPAGETNVVECCCDEYAEEFKLLAAAPGKEGV